MRKKKAVIIGAGLAGLSLASELADEGFEVEIFEKNYYLGGRASDLVDHKTHDSVPIGPHVFCQMYVNCWHFLKKIGAQRLISWERNIFIEVVHQGKHHKMFFHDVPAPLFVVPWLATFPFIGVRDKLSCVIAALDIITSSEERIERLDGLTAVEYLRSKGVSQKAIDLFWGFITLSLLNISLDKCSAAEFVMLIQKWTHLKHRKFGFSTVGLGEVYTDDASAYIHARGGKSCVRTSVQQIVCNGNAIDHLIVASGEYTREVRADMYVSTLQPIQLRELLPEGSLRESLQAFEPVPYLSVNLWFDKKITRKQFWAMLDDPANPQYLNTDFYDLSNIYVPHKDTSYIASNIINNPRAEAMSDEEIVAQTLREIQEAFPRMDAKITHSHVHRTPYVIYAPQPGARAHKQGPRTQYSNLYLAGDWTVRELPQCMEAAVRSGYRCAEAILEDNGIHKKICEDRVY